MQLGLLISTHFVIRFDGRAKRFEWNLIKYALENFNKFQQKGLQLPKIIIFWRNVKFYEREFKD